jgi:hypothetical protein
MKTQRRFVALIGFLMVLVLVVPTAGASHNSGSDHIWNDSGINTRLVQPATLSWNDAGLNTQGAQLNTTGWNDVAWGTRQVPATVGWSDAGANIGW